MMMMRGPETRPSPSRPGPAFGAIGATVLVSTIAFLALVAPSASAGSYGYGADVSWSNGIVLCQFSSVSPDVAVSHASMSSTGVTVSLLGMSEARSNGSVMASADLGGLSWTVANRSSEDAYDLAYTLHVPLISSATNPMTVGSADLTVQFVLPAYQGSPEGSTDTVTALFSIANWTWQSPGDHLALTFAAAPTYPTSEHLNATSAAGWLLASTSTSSGAELERIGANATATITTGSGPATPISAAAALSIASPSWATVSVTFGSEAGSFTTLTYNAHIGVVLPATVAGIPLSELAAAAAAGASVSLVIAVVARRVRRRPSTLVYVTEEEKP